MKAKLLVPRADCTVGKVYEVRDVPEYNCFEFTDDVGDKNTAMKHKFEVIPDEPSAEPAATTNVVDTPTIRTFETGATRNLDNNKLDHEGFLSPLVIEAFGNYMQSHRLQKDGTMRASDNWQKGIPFDAYMKSGWRHFFDWWKLHRGLDATSPEDGHKIDKVEALCALMFNVQGYMHELLKERGDGD
jgi:hypothetical protein